MFSRRKFMGSTLMTAIALSLATLHDSAYAANSQAVNSGTEWWRNAVIYQVYPRSFADSNGDGMGDIPGITSRLPYLASLGVNAVWLSPFYRSPQADGGYDVADYRAVDPLFGALNDFEQMLQSAHAKGLKVIVDLVPNHTSDEHAWFQAALKSPPGSSERARYIFRDGRGENGELPPNNWQSVFGNSAWDRVPGEKQWYLHLFDTKQPDLNWDNLEVRAEFESIIRFWLERGIDGFRVDVSQGLVKAAGLPDAEIKKENGILVGPMWDQDGVHEIYRSWRRILNEYPGERMMVAEAVVGTQSRPKYIRPDEMQQAFNFDYLLLEGWDASAFRKVIDSSMALAATVGAPTTWVNSNHDVVRTPSRYGQSKPGIHPRGIGAASEQPDEALGLRRARALSMLTMALPGSAYIYQGEELGLPEHTTLEDKYRQDPEFFRNKDKEGIYGRDGCRVPLPWKAGAPSLGFGPSDKTWLPQPASYTRYAVDRQEGVAGSTLELYRQILQLRHKYSLGNGQVQWLDADKGVLAFDNGDLRIMINFGTKAVALPADRKVLLSSEALQEDKLPGNTAVWLTRS